MFYYQYVSFLLENTYSRVKWGEVVVRMLSTANNLQSVIIHHSLLLGTMDFTSDGTFWGTQPCGHGDHARPESYTPRGGAGLPADLVLKNVLDMESSTSRERILKYHENLPFLLSNYAKYEQEHFEMDSHIHSRWNMHRHLHSEERLARH